MNHNLKSHKITIGMFYSSYFYSAFQFSLEMILKTQNQLNGNTTRYWVKPGIVFRRENSYLLLIFQQE